MPELSKAYFILSVSYIGIVYIFYDKYSPKIASSIQNEIMSFLFISVRSLYLKVELFKVLRIKITKLSLNAVIFFYIKITKF